MKELKKLLVFLCAGFWCSFLYAESHFSFNYHDFQHSMTIYFMLQKEGADVTDLENYEVAAFVGNECRGIGSFNTITDNLDVPVTYGYLRVYSNAVSGEKITFKIYNKNEESETSINGVSIDFAPDTAVGLPSSPTPFTIDQVLLGDVNGDGAINASDLSAVINKILKRPNPVFIDAAADMNSDGYINAADLSAIINIILKK